MYKRTLEAHTYSPPQVTSDEATELCVYHLRMAAALFQLVPNDKNAALHEEIRRVCDDIEGPPAVYWASSIFGIYDQIMKAEA